MKKLFSKRSGFTLVEIIIAFAIFAIMASMIVQVMNLMVRQKVRNKKFEDNLSVQEQSFIARAKDMNYNDAGDADGQLTLLFKDKGGSDLTVEPIDYQLKNWDPDNYKNGINYFVGDYDYDAATAGTEYSGSEEDPEDTDPADLGGSTLMSRFDTRITGTKGILSVKIEMEETDEDNVINVTVTVDDSSVATVNRGHSQVSIFFAEGKANGKPFEVLSVNGGDKTQNSLKRVKLCGSNGVNVHCGYGGNSQTFTVEFADNVNIADISFGQNSTDGKTYIQFKNGEDYYANIFGAYLKGGDKTPAEDTPGEDTTEE